MKRATLMLAAMTLLFAGKGKAFGDFITYTASSPTYNGSMPAFDSNLGDLTAITVTVTTTFTGQGTFYYPLPSYSAPSLADFSAFLTGYYAIGTPSYSHQDSVTTSTIFGQVPLYGSTFVTFPTATEVDSTIITNPADFQEWIPSGPVLVVPIAISQPLLPIVTFQSDGPVQFQAAYPAETSYTLDLTYTYTPIPTPEPSSLTLLCTALATLTGYVGWQRRK